jgi:cyanophycinase
MLSNNWSVLKSLEGLLRTSGIFFIPVRMNKSLLLFLSVFLPMQVFAMKIFRSGNPNDVRVRTESLACLAGGGSDDSWAEGWQALIEHAHGGDVVIIRADGSRGGYESWIYEDTSGHGFSRVNSVSTLVLEGPADANRSEALQLLRNAELIFFAGGDQSEYITWLKASPLAREIEDAVFRRGIPIAGTSAGMAILGGIDFAAKYGSPRDPDDNLSSEDALTNPLAKQVDMDVSLLTLPYLNRVTTDTHFSQRGREGRLIAFMARSMFDHLQGADWKNIRGIGADEGTAFCYSADGIGQVYGAGSVYFLSARTPAEKIVKDQPLVWYGNGQAIAVQRLVSREPHARFDLNSWTAENAFLESWWVDQQGKFRRVR